MKIRIYDTNNWVRLVLEKNPYGLRALWNEVIKKENVIKIFCFEGKNGNWKRRSLYPEYKIKRELPVDTFFENLNFFKDLLRNSPQNVMSCWADGFEADDVINHIANQFKKSEVEILTTDRDLTQSKFAKFPMIKNELVKDRDFVRTYKTLVGDPSDNIKGLVGFGKSSWEKCEKEWDFLRNWCEGCYHGVKLSCENVDLPEKVKNVLRNADVNQVGVYWTITGFYEVEELKTVCGDGRIDISEEKLGEYLL